MEILKNVYIQPDQINMAVFFWCPVKSDMYMCTYDKSLLTFYKVLETHGHVKLVTLYLVPLGRRA